jgi:RNA polymerase sigma-70 factor (ECF subfamily)
MTNLGIKTKGGSLSELVNDPVEMAVLHDRLFPRLFRYARFRLNDADVAEDLASEAFLRLLETAHHKSIQIDNIDGWLMGTLSNMVNDQLRNRYRTPASKLNETLISHQPGPHSVIEQSERQESVSSALMRLTDDQQQVLSLRFGSGLSLAETARTMEKNENAVKALQFRALNALRRQMEEEPHE